MFNLLDTGRPRLSAPMTLMAMSVIGLFVTGVICVISATGRGFIALDSALGIIALRVSALGVAISVLWLVAAKIIRTVRG